MNPIANLTPEELDQRLNARSPRLLVLYLWGSDCPNCLIFKRSLPKLFDRLADIDADFVELDVYAYPEIATRYGVFGIPHFVLFKGGTKIGKMSEFRGENYWADVIREHA